jgi:alpha-L-fucosidase
MHTTLQSINIHTMRKQGLRATLLGGLLLAGLSGSTALGKDDIDYEPYMKASPETMKIWRDRSYGMFIHWDMSSLLGVEISWAMQTRVDVEGEGEIPNEVYNNLYKSFNPQEFDAKEIVKAAQDAGMRYIIITAKHHGGFCMFDTQYTDYKITNTAFKRDVIKELADACHEADMAFGFYYSQPDWHHPDFIKKDFDAYRPYLYGQIEELCSNYGKIDMIFFDGLFYGDKEYQCKPLFKLIRTLQPDVVINDRCGWVYGDYTCPEQVVGAFNNQRFWESCITLGTAWSWKLNDRLKSPEECIRMLISTAGGDGNLLLNVGPMPTGMIEPRQVALLKKVGDWLEQYGETIYGTRGGPYKPGQWGASTHRGNTIYMHITSWEDMPESFPLLGVEIKKAELITGGRVAIQKSGKGLKFAVEKESQMKPSTIIKLTLAGEASAIEPIDLPSRSLAKNAKVKVSGNKHLAGNLIDGNAGTEWKSDSKQCWIELDLHTEVTFDRINIREEGNEWDVRTSDFLLECKVGNEWVTLDKGSKIGKTYSIGFDQKSARYIRLKINDAGVLPRFAEIEVEYRGDKK